MSDTINLTKLLKLRKDRYAKNQGNFVLDCETYRDLGSDRAVWAHLIGLGGKEFTVVLICENLKRRVWVGRQGVYDSKADGMVSGKGHAMRCADKLNISFWTAAYGDKLNTGTGFSYRTIKAARVIAIRCEGETYVTQLGFEMIELAQSL